MKIQFIAERPVGGAWEEQLLSVFLVADGLMILVIWATSLAHGAFPAGLMVYQEGNYPILHLIAELLMAALALTAGVSLWLRLPWSRGMALCALGALAYATINSTGWALRKDPGLLLPLIANLVAVILVVPYLLHREHKDHDEHYEYEV
ncbi:MAG: hypothetical protein MI924_33670 [Chloroflexales bacterium]|nr:hypothetical protein [Chloroflexales bacterium]